jgi:hypothetical protein
MHLQVLLHYPVNINAIVEQLGPGSDQAILELHLVYRIQKEFFGLVFLALFKEDDTVEVHDFGRLKVFYGFVEGFYGREVHRGLSQHHLEHFHELVVIDQEVIVSHAAGHETDFAAFNGDPGSGADHFDVWMEHYPAGELYPIMIVNLI